jgi:hypothetical protein
MKDKTVLAWHFCGSTLRDGRSIPRKGAWLKHEGPVEMCAAGLHASRRLIDALTYAPGNNLCRVECRKIEAEQDGTLVCRERKIIARFDAEELLWRASRKFALDVIHLWDAPAVVVKFLKTGDPSLRAAAWDVAGDVTRAAAWDVAGDVTRAAAWDVARDAAWAAAGDVTRAAAWAVAWDVARDVAGDVTRPAAWDVAREKQNRWLTREAMKIIRRTR